MNDADLVRGVERAGDLTRQRHRALQAQRASPAHPVAERLTLEPLHHQVGAAVARGPGVEHLDDARVLERGRGPDLAEEVGHRGRIAAQLRRQHLDVGLATDDRVLGQIRGAQAPGAELAGDAVVAYNLSDFHPRSISRGPARPGRPPGGSLRLSGIALGAA